MLADSHKDKVAAALKLIPPDVHAANFEVVTEGYMSLGYLFSEAQLAEQADAPVPDRSRVIDLVEEDAIRISNRESILPG